MTHLHRQVAKRIDDWRANGYSCAAYPAIAEITDWALDRESGHARLVLRKLELPPVVEYIYFAGGLTDPNKTDFFVEYKDEGGKWRRYTPDFVIRKKPRKGETPGGGKVLIVEIKKEHDRDHPVDGERGRKAMALRRWEGLNPDRLRYHMVFTDAETVASDQIREARAFVEEADP